MRALASLLFLSVVAPHSLSSQTALAHDTTQAFFQRLVTRRIAAKAGADTAALRKLLDPRLIYLDNDGSRQTVEEHLATVAAAGKEEGTEHEVDSLHVLRIGDVALVDYRSVVRMRFGSRDLVWPFRSQDTFALRGGRWLLLGHNETHILDVPSAVPVDSALLAEYAGRYEWWPGNIDTITRRGDRLSHQLTVEERALPIEAATPESFHEVGDPILAVFTRDTAGRVTGYVLHFPDGQVIRARKLP